MRLEGIPPLRLKMLMAIGMRMLCSICSGTIAKGRQRP
jgi:hypothetical protein